MHLQHLDCNDRFALAACCMCLDSASEVTPVSLPQTNQSCTEALHVDTKRVSTGSLESKLIIKS